ncbi:hypothetical protein DERF_012654 [Dermatophagoides farinae]|uniref:Potassium channel domain-containing protein n=1 Tax=Dermatophagoides farinae TaxID=6954 RepID=A0A922L3N3_DERFA|nr:hypothetical protein DERF_012654 [Dermatophagoides farinae]
MSSYRTDPAYQTEAVNKQQQQQHQQSYNSINKSTADIKTNRRNNNKNGGNNNNIVRRQWNFCFKFFAFIFSHIGLGCLVLAYTIIGAFLFRHFEEPNIIERNRLIERIRNETVDRLWIETYKLNVLYKENWTTMATKEIEQFQRTLIDSFKDGYWPMVYDLTGTSSSSTTTINNDDNVDNGDDQQSIEHHQQNSDDQQQQQQHYQYSNHQHLYTRWSFIDSWMYSISIITTIGYANRPLTVEGKLTTIIYALFGIPIMLLFLSTIGSLLGRGLKYLYQFCCHCNPNGVDSSSSSSLQHSFQNLPTPTTTIGATTTTTTTPNNNNNNSQDHLHHLQQHHHHDNYQIHHIALNNIGGGDSSGLLSTLDMNNIGNKTKNYAQLNSIYPPVSGTGTGHYDNRACSCDLLDPNAAAITTTTAITDPTAKLSDPLVMDHHHHICDTKFQTYPGTGTTLDPHHHFSTGVSGCDGSPFNTAFHHPIHHQSTNKLDLDLHHQHLHHHHHHHLYHKLHQSDSSNFGFDDFGANNSRQATDNVPFYFCFLLITLYIMAGSVMFHIWEGLPILDGAYFCFVTLSTIGFGDILPEKTLSSSSSTTIATTTTVNQPSQTESKKRIIIIVIYILGGMTLVAMSFNLIYEQLAFKFKKIGYKIQLQQQRHQQRMDEIIMKENSMKMMNHHQHGSSSLQQSHQQQQTTTSIEISNK